MVRWLGSLGVLSFCVDWAPAFLGAGAASLSRASTGPNSHNFMSSQGDANSKWYTEHEQRSSVLGDNDYILLQFGAEEMAQK